MKSLEDVADYALASIRYTYEHPVLCSYEGTVFWWH